MPAREVRMKKKDIVCGQICAATFLVRECGYSYRETERILNAGVSIRNGNRVWEFVNDKCVARRYTKD